MKNILSGFILVTFCSSIALGQNYPHLLSVKIDSRVSLDPTNQMYFYSYKLKNELNNTGDITNFRVDISRGPNTVAFDTVGLQFDSDFERGSFRRNYPGLASRIVTVGFPHLPSIHWIGVLAPAFTAARFGCDTLFIAPGDSVSGLVLMSKGLPGIRKCTVEPHFDPYALFPDYDEEEDTLPPPLTVEQMDSITQASNFHGYTVGPTAPHTPFNGLNFLDTLLSYTRQSAELGWLGRNRDDDCDDDERPDDGAVRNIENRLQKARRELVRRDSVKARKELEKLVRKVDRLRRRGERVMTSEAYALLKYNTEYLIERLPEKRRR